MQVVLMGLVFFGIPGAFNSIIGLNSGIPDKYTNAGYGALYFIFALGSLVSPALVNKFGPRTMMFLGGSVYVVFSLSLLLAGPLHVIPLPAVTICAALVGFGAAVLWSGNGAMLLSYPTESTRASYIATFWIIFNLGAVIGGIQSFVTNLNKSGKDDGVSPSTFIIYIAMGIAGSLLVWLLLPLEEVQRIDGTKCEKPHFASPREEIRGMCKMFCSTHVVALLPLFVYSNWFYSYQLGVFAKGVFMPAASGLASAFYWGAQMVGAKTLSFLLDADRIPAGKRAWMSFGASTVLIGATWIWGGLANQKYMLDSQTRVQYEYNESGFIEAAILMMFWGYCDALVQTWCYWVMTQLYTKSEDFSRMAGIFKFAQSMGSAASFMISYGNPTATTQLGICILLFVLSIPGAGYLCDHVSKSQSARQRKLPALINEDLETNRSHEDAIKANEIL